jgi:hypothetical protein
MKCCKILNCHMLMENQSKGEVGNGNQKGHFE